MHHSAILVTGGAGFIGSQFIRDWLAEAAGSVVNLDALTYAVDLPGLQELAAFPDYTFVRGDIGDEALVARLLADSRPAAIVNFAAETHVDRSIRAPAAFVQTNIVGTMRLLETVLRYWRTLPAGTAKERFRFVQISTDEVFGSLREDDIPFSHDSAYAPNNPYSASKAAADHLVRAWNRTYGLPSITLHCSNHYGPRQNPEKLIPLLIERGLAGEPMPIYGDGANQRDWVYVADGCAAMRLALMKGKAGTRYAIGTGVGTANLEIARKICALLDELHPMDGGARHESLIRFVPDRPGHDRRYVVDASRLHGLAGWVPVESVDSGLRKTVLWHLGNRPNLAKVAGRPALLQP